MKKKCPRCGTKLAGLVECEICGFIFDEFDSAKNLKTRASIKSKNYFFLIFILAAGMVSWYHFKLGPEKGTLIGKIRWIMDYRQGMSIAGETGKPVMLFFAASWCASCKSVINTAFSDPQVVKATENLIPIYVDADQNRQLLANYNVRGVPTVLFLTRQGQFTQKLEGPYDTRDYKDAIDKVTGR